MTVEENRNPFSLVPQVQGRWILSSPQQKHNPTAKPACSRHRQGRRHPMRVTRCSSIVIARRLTPSARAPVSRSGAASRAIPSRRASSQDGSSRRRGRGTGYRWTYQYPSRAFSGTRRQRSRQGHSGSTTPPQSRQRVFCSLSTPRRCLRGRTARLGRPRPDDSTGDGTVCTFATSLALLTRTTMRFPRGRSTLNSPGWTRTNNPSVNSRMLCQLSYRGSPKRPEV